MMENIVIAAALIADIGLTAYIPHVISRRIAKKQEDKDCTAAG